MKKSGGHSIDFKNFIPLSLLVFLIVLIYSNAFHAEWHLDDYANIIKNPHIHVKEIDLKSLGNTFYFKDDGKISRPLARLTFALNWYIGKGNVVGYHIVNIIIHFLTAFFLFLFILKLFDTLNLKDKYSENDGYFIAMLSTVLWAAHPIQIQAVTYIVQRMASMAAMFYIMSMYFYLKGRLDSLPAKKILFFIAASISFGFGLATKENTATLPIAVLLLEIIFIQDVRNRETRKKLLWVSTIVCGVVVLSSSWLFLNNGLSALFKESKFRYFTPMQRLMTEPRVIFFYLSEIFYPVPARFSIEHDFAISTSLLKPWTTLPAMVFIILLICFGILTIRKRPFLSFGIIFFMLNHAIESTVVGLEIVFEHRNYLPSFFIFSYISAVIKWMVDHYYNKSKVIYLFLVAFIIFMIMSFGISTYTRNIVWKTEQSLLEDAVKKVPSAARPLSNLARIYYMKMNRPDVALKMLQKSLTLKKNNTHQESTLLYNIGTIYFDNGRDRSAIPYLRKAIQKPPHHSAARYKLTVALANTGKRKEAKKHLDILISKLPDNVNSPINLKGLILVKEKKFKEAFYMFKKCLGVRNNDKNALLNIGALYFKIKNYQKAETFFKIAYDYHPHEPFTLLWLIEVNLKTHDEKDVRRYLGTLFLNLSAQEVLSLPKTMSNTDVYYTGFIKPGPSKVLASRIAQKMRMNY